MYRRNVSRIQQHIRIRTANLARGNGLLSDHVTPCSMIGRITNGLTL